MVGVLSKMFDRNWLTLTVMYLIVDVACNSSLLERKVIGSKFDNFDQLTKEV